jgi:hypothetical protein
LADPLPHDAVSDRETRLTALHIYDDLMDAIQHDVEPEPLIAAAWMFEDLCEEMEVDPIDTLCQLLDLERPEMTEDVGPPTPLDMEIAAHYLAEHPELRNEP